MSPSATRLQQSITADLTELARALDEQHASGRIRRYLDTMARFHRYSWGNCWLIARQCPHASLVAGYQAWKQMNRQVRKGEHAIRILAPCPVRRRRNRQEADADDDNEDADADRAEQTVYFRTACVFDISQTDGDALPEIELPNVSAPADALLESLMMVASDRDIQVVVRDLGDETFGRSHGGLVEVNSRYATGQQAKTLVHELAHEAMHRGADRPKDRGTVELEAEAVAYVVCRRFALDVELRASRYIALWGGDAKALAGSLSRVSETARQLIHALERAMGRRSNPPLAAEAAPGRAAA